MFVWIWRQNIDIVISERQDNSVRTEWCYYCGSLITDAAANVAKVYKWWWMRFCSSIEEDDDDDDISGWNERKQITVRQQTNEREKRPHKICLQAHHWLKISHGKMARSHSIACAHTHRPQNHQAMPQTSSKHTYLRASVGAMSGYVSNKKIGDFFPETQNQKFAGKNESHTYMTVCVRLSFILLFCSDFIRFHLHFTYEMKREIGFCAREYWSAPQNYIHLSCASDCFYLFAFISLCWAQLWHITFPSVWFVSWKPTNQLSVSEWLSVFGSFYLLIAVFQIYDNSELYIQKKNVFSFYSASAIHPNLIFVFWVF